MGSRVPSRRELFGMLVLMLAGGCATPEAIEGPTALAARASGGANPVVDATDPNQSPQDSTLDVLVLGSNFDSGSSAQFLLNGKVTPKVKTNSTTFVSPTKLKANITIAVDAVVAPYDVQVTAAGGRKGIGIEKFSVLQKSNPGQWNPPQLTVTFGQGLGGTDAVRGDYDAYSPYVALAHIALNGNLVFWLGAGSPRFVKVKTTAFDGVTRNRIFTNNHSNPGGGDDSFGLLGMVEGSTGSAVFEAELHVSSTAPYEVLRYGKDCSGTGSGGGVVVPANKVITTRSADGRTWTIAGSNGVHCKQVAKKPGLSQVGTAGSFSMTLVWP